MPPLTRQQLQSRRARKRSDERRRHRRAVVSAAVPAVAVALLTLALWVVLGRSGTSTPANPAPDLVVGPGTRPKDIPIARAGLVQLRLPVDQARVTAIAFRPSENPSAVGLDPIGPLKTHTADRAGRAGPDRAAVDVGAAAGTLVFSPVDGIVVGRSDWVIRGQGQGYQVSIEPQSASDVTVVVTHIQTHPGSPTPEVGQTVRAGLTPLGEVIDLSGVIPQELAQFTADSGNHVAIEVLRTGAD